MLLDFRALRALDGTSCHRCFACQGHIISVQVKWFSSPLDRSSQRGVNWESRFSKRLRLVDIQIASKLLSQRSGRQTLMMVEIEQQDMLCCAPLCPDPRHGTSRDISSCDLGYERMCLFRYVFDSLVSRSNLVCSRS